MDKYYIVTGTINEERAYFYLDEQEGYYVRTQDITESDFFSCGEIAVSVLQDIKTQTDIIDNLEVLELEINVKDSIFQDGGRI